MFFAASSLFTLLFLLWDFHKRRRKEGVFVECWHRSMGFFRCRRPHFLVQKIFEI